MFLKLIWWFRKVEGSDFEAHESPAPALHEDSETDQIILYTVFPHATFSMQNPPKFLLNLHQLLFGNGPVEIILQQNVMRFPQRCFKGTEVWARSSHSFRAAECTVNLEMPDVAQDLFQGRFL